MCSSGKMNRRRYSIGRTVNELGKMLFIFGLMIAGIGLLIWTGFGKDWLGRVPRDIPHTQRHFYFPLPPFFFFLLNPILAFLPLPFPKNKLEMGHPLSLKLKGSN